MFKFSSFEFPILLVLILPLQSCTQTPPCCFPGCDAECGIETWEQVWGGIPKNGCEEFYKCEMLVPPSPLTGKGVWKKNEFSCQKGLLFDAFFQQCRYPVQHAGAEAPAVCLCPPIKDPPDYGSGCKVGGNIHELDEGGYHGDIYVTQGCTGYYQVLDQGWGLKPSDPILCGDGMQFDVESQTCNWGDQVDCECGADASPPPPALSPTGCGSGCDVGADMYSLQDCTGYYYCINDNYQETQPCPDGLKFDSKTRNCLPAEQAWCCDEPPPTKAPIQADCGDDDKCSVGGDLWSMPDCTGYYYCIDGQKSDEHPCPAGLKFDSIIKNCLPEESATCCGVPPPTEAPVAADCGENEDCFVGADLWALEGCSGYYYCIDGKKSEIHNCPDGTKFDSQIKNCIWADSAACCGQTKSPTPSECGNEDCFVGADLWALPDCSGYFYCVEGEKIDDDHICPDGTKFDSQIKNCIWADQATCCGQTKSPTPSECGPDECFVGADLWALPDCTGYFYCEDGIKRDENHMCPEGTKFDSQIKNCIWADQATCCGQTKSPTPSECGPDECFVGADLWALPDCSGYYYCVDGIKRDEDHMCPEGTKFDHAMQNCIWADQATCCGQTKSPTPSECGPDECFVGADLWALEDCSGYYYCVDGIKRDEDHMCPEGTKFDHAMQNCIWADQATCCGQTKAPSSASCGQAECYVGSDLYSLPDCTGYYYCVNGIPSAIHPCQADTLFDSNIKNCVWEASATCCGVAPPQPAPKGVDCSSGCHVGGGLYSLQDCKGYYYCVDGLASEVRPCQAGALFDSNIKNCVWEASATCCGVAPPQLTPTGGTCDSGCDVGGDLYSLDDCTGYYYCVNGLASEIRHCQDGTLFDSFAKNCVWAGEATCCGVPPPPLAATGGDCSEGCHVGGDMYSTSDCTGFYYCLDGAPSIVKPCPTGTLFDSNIRNCVWADHATCCGVAPVQPSSTVGGCSSGCYAGGDLYATSDCSGYFYCINGVSRAVRSCSPGTLFDISISNCNWPWLFTCSCFASAIASPPPAGGFQMLSFESEFSGQSLSESLALSVVESPSPFYPDWVKAMTCVDDGEQPGYLADSYLSDTLEECCSRWFWYREKCSGSSAPGGIIGWFPDWSEAGSKCLQDEQPPSWISGAYFYQTKQECCDAQFWWNQECINI